VRREIQPALKTDEVKLTGGFPAAKGKRLSQFRG